MICCLVRTMRASRMLHPEAAETWIFAAGGEEGHIVEQKEDREVLSKWGNDLRHTYRTIGQEVLLSPIDMHLLMNHSVKKGREHRLHYAFEAQRPPAVFSASADGLHDRGRDGTAQGHRRARARLAVIAFAPDR